MQSANQFAQQEAESDAALIAELLPLANSLMEGATLSESEATMHAYLNHKGGDPRLIQTYRAIARPSAKRAALGELLTNRLKDLPGYWPTLQYTAVEGQHTEDTLGVLQMALSRISSGEEEAALMVIVDLDLAYSKLSHDYLYKLLERDDFPPTIINFVKGLFANAHVIIAVNDVDTSPIKLGRGFVHGDPAAPCLFSAAVRPLLTLLEENGLGITLGGDDGPQLKVPYLATPEHLITFVQRPEQLAVLQRQLDVFANASGTAMFEGKIKTIVLSSANDDPAALAELERACPWPIVAPEEFHHLGHVINLRTGGVAQQRLAANLDELRLQSSVAAAGSTGYFERVGLATELLPSLCSSMALTPHPKDFGAKVIKSLGPWEWPTGERMSVKDLTTPQQLGGPGLPDPDKMLIATTGAAIVRFLRRQDEIGTFFRRCLHDYLRDEQGLSEASLLLHEGETFETRINSRRLAQDSFWANVVWTLAQLGVSLDEDWSKYKLPELLALPYAYPAFGTDPRFRKVNNFVNASQRDRLDLWGDIAWGKEVDGQQAPTLTPPSKAAMLRYKHELRCSEARDKSVGDMAHFIELDWDRWFATLPPKVKELLRQMPDEYELTAGSSRENVDDGSSSVRPFEWDLDDIEYPWHLNKIAGLRLEEFTVERAYAKLAPSELTRPGV